MIHVYSMRSDQTDPMDDYACADTYKYEFYYVYIFKKNFWS